MPLHKRGPIKWCSHHDYLFDLSIKIRLQYAITGSLATDRDAVTPRPTHGRSPTESVRAAHLRNQVAAYVFRQVSTHFSESFIIFTFGESSSTLTHAKTIIYTYKESEYRRLRKLIPSSFLAARLNRPASRPASHSGVSHFRI